MAHTPRMPNSSRGGDGGCTRRLTSVLVLHPELFLYTFFRARPTTTSNNNNNNNNSSSSNATAAALYIICNFYLGFSQKNNKNKNDGRKRKNKKQSDTACITHVSVCVGQLDGCVRIPSMHALISRTLPATRLHESPDTRILSRHTHPKHRIWAPGTDVAAKSKVLGCQKKKTGASQK